MRCSVRSSRRCAYEYNRARMHWVGLSGTLLNYPGTGSICNQQFSVSRTLRYIYIYIYIYIPTSHLCQGADTQECSSRRDDSRCNESLKTHVELHQSLHKGSFARFLEVWNDLTRFLEVWNDLTLSPCVTTCVLVVLRASHASRDAFMPHTFSFK